MCISLPHLLGIAADQHQSNDRQSKEGVERAHVSIRAVNRNDERYDYCELLDNATNLLPQISQQIGATGLGNTYTYSCKFGLMYHVLHFGAIWCAHPTDIVR